MWLMSRRQSCAVFTNVSVCLFVTGDVTNNFLNENFLLIADELGQPTYRALGMIVHQIVIGLAEEVPYDELFTKDN